MKKRYSAFFRTNLDELLQTFAAELLHTLTGHEGSVESVAISADGVDTCQWQF